jgi:ubiquinone/menaquinone biosynthesis C-methylase UbiE
MKESDLKRITESNRAAWNEVMPLHQRAASVKLDRLFSQPGHVHLDATEVDLLERIELTGKNVAHLCCNNGSELLSLKNLGAAECVGFDICDLAIQEARQRAAANRIDCQFVRTDVYEIDPIYEQRFDLVYISAGCLGWLPDLQQFFARAAVLLKLGGRVFIHEIHPFSEMLPFDEEQPTEKLGITSPYFKKEPYLEQGGLDYIGHAEYASTTTQYQFVHTLSDILMGLINNNLQIEQFHEYEQDISAGHRRIEEAKAGIPLSYILIGRKA